MGAGSMDTALLLPVSSSTGIKKKSKSRFRMVLSVQEVLKWAILAAVLVVVSMGISAAIFLVEIPIPSPSGQTQTTATILQLQPPELTPAQDLEVESFGEGFLWLTVLQAAAATVGLLLPRCRVRSRWWLALVAIVSATVAHYMESRLVLVFIAANPGDIAYAIVSGVGAVLALGIDLLGLISLLIGGRESIRLSTKQASRSGAMDEKVAVAMEDDKVVKFPAPLMVDNKVLPVTSMEIKKEEEEKEAPFPMLLPVQRVLQWAFLVACWVAASILLSYIPIPCSQSKTAWIFQCPDLTPAQGVEVDTYGDAFLWLTVPQAAAATVGLLLPRRHTRGRWSLALVAVVSATVAHYMMSRAALVFIAANPGDVGFIILFVVGVVGYLAGDLLGLISLLIKGPEQENSKQILRGSTALIRQQTDPTSMGAALLPVTSSTAIKKNKSRFSILLSVQEVLVYALFESVGVALTLGVIAAIVFVVISIPTPIPIPITIPSTLQPPDLTPAQEAEVESFGLGFLWLMVPQAAAAAVGLLLPRHRARARWYLALAAIISATGLHYMSTRIGLFFIAANPEHIGYDILVGGGGVLILGFDLFGLISLLIGGPE
ncbi:hypothetical protein EJB05_29612 [Eragrostis curvula]|uniref:Uncharacterized protein n=1 Tax=Eragrostis curvula TaxID=38414 RepID=A0A5J9UUH4_9POAL|nr:hypothetical protein EJB05_29612 [Eragrostis curvula]